MTIGVRCENPECEKPLRVKDELAGKRIKCPVCKELFLVRTPENTDDEEGGEQTLTTNKKIQKMPPPTPVIEEDVDENDDEKYGEVVQLSPKQRRTKARKRARFLVRLGLTFHLVATILVFLGIAVGYLGIILPLVAMHADAGTRKVTTRTNFETGEVTIISVEVTQAERQIMIVVGFMILGGCLSIFLAGCCEIPCAILCLWIPDRKAFRILLATLLLRAMVPVVAVGFFLIADYRRADMVRLYFVLLLVLSFGAWCSWFFFLKHVGTWVKSVMLEKEATDVLTSSLITAAGLFLVVILLFIGTFVPRGTGPFSAPWGLLVDFIGLLVLCHLNMMIRACSLVESVLTLSGISWCLRYFNCVLTLRGDIR